MHFNQKFIISLVILNLVNLIYTIKLNENLINSTNNSNQTLINILKSSTKLNESNSTSSLSSTTETTATNEFKNNFEPITTIRPQTTESSSASSINQNNVVKIVSTSSKYSVSSSISSISTSASWPRKVTKQCTCGVQNNEETLVDPMPHSFTVGITRYENSPIVCSGSLINNYYVLTTANCARMITGNSRVIIVAPEANQTKNELDDQSQFFRAHTISDVKINPKFVSNLTNAAKFVLKNDIALIKLNEKIDFSANNTRASTICLPSSSTSYLDSLNMYYDSKNLKVDHIDHETAAITGYALISFNERNELTDDYKQNSDTYRLWAREATVLSSKECKSIWQTFYIKGKSLCTHARNNGLCDGSLGSSLSVLRYGREQMIGLLNLGSRQCGRSSMPDLFVDVAPYLNWIYKNTVDSVYCSEHYN